MFSSNLDENKDFTLVDKEEDGNQGPEEHLVPDINCLANDFP